MLLLAGLLVVSAGCVRKNGETTAMGGVPGLKRQAAAPQNDVVQVAQSRMGTPYRYGGTSPDSGFDCSGLVCWTYEQVGISLPRSAREQIAFGHKVTKEELQPGDVVVFKGTRNRSGYHSGIYVGDNKFIHSPRTGKTVTEESLDTRYYAERFAGGRRIPRDGSAAVMLAEFKAQAREEAVQRAAGAPSKRDIRRGKKGGSSRDAMVADAGKRSGRGKTAAVAAGGKNRPGAKDKGPASVRNDRKAGGSTTAATSGSPRLQQAGGKKKAEEGTLQASRNAGNGAKPNKAAPKK